MSRAFAIGAVAAMTFAACGGDDDSTSGDEPAGAESDAGSAAEPAAEPAAESGGGSGGGSGELVIGDETIELTSTRCFLQEQDAAAGGGKILFVAQGEGVNAAGEEVLVDVSRYDEDSQFVGDDILVDIGDIFSDDAISLSAQEEIGTVTVDGSRVSASDLTFTNFDDFSEQPGSFEINC